jgi:release factor glutamine methyltransferase
MKLKDIKEIFWQELEPLYPREEVNNFFYRLVEHYLGLDRFILVMDPGYRIAKNEEQPLFLALARLKEEYPIQYILGTAYFMDMEFHVNDQVLIPRPETEELVRWILADLPHMPDSPAILDVGTGSGCIAVSLAKYWPAARVTALDISPAAIITARKNAARHVVNIDFVQADILTNYSSVTKWDIIVSNPPYVRESEKEDMRNNVKRYEPASALFVPDDSPLLFYEHITRFASRALKAGGTLYLEVNQYLGTDTLNLLRAQNFLEIKLRKDMFGNERMLKAIMPLKP